MAQFDWDGNLTVLTIKSGNRAGTYVLYVTWRHIRARSQPRISQGILNQ